MARPEVKDISEIKEIFAHPQAISQCERTFAEKYPEIKLIKGTDADDTALCAKRIANNEFPKTTATLASQIAARLYGLNILEYGMHHDPFNTTTMLVIKKKNAN
jgi:prephenate dehydratase